MSGYDLYYWPGIQGRGEFIRLALEATGTPYRDVAREKGVAAMTRRMRSGKHPPFAPPFLVDGETVVAQVALILHYLAPRIGLAPEGEAAQLWAHQIQLTITDIVFEAHETHHPVGSGLYYEEQKPEAKRRAEHFREVRMPRFLAWLEQVAAANGGGHMVGPRLTPADTSVFQLLEGLHYAFPRATRGLPAQYPALHAVHAAVVAVPGIAAYLASERRIAFNEDGIFRHYPELDAPI